MLTKKENKRNVVKQKPLSEIVAEELRKRIWNGEFQFGERLIEAELASEMDISRSSLREAFQTLEYEKLVINKARKGTFINNLTEKDVQEITEVRLWIEVPALVQTAENLRTEDSEYLEHQLELMKKNLEEENWYELFNIEMEFHRYLVDLCHNSRIRDIYSALLIQIRTFFNLFKDYYANDKESFFMEHKELLDAIKTGDKEVIEESAISHIKLLPMNYSKVQSNMRK